MAWKRHDPFDEKRRELEKQQRLLAEQMSRLMSDSGQGADDGKSAEPPVWRMEDDGSHPRQAPSPTPARRRNLARQRQRDMLLFFLLILALILVVAMAMWVAYVRNASPINGA